MTSKFFALAAFAPVLVSALSIVQGAHSAPGRPLCLVSNERTGVGAQSLQQAVDTAAAGDTLIVKGTCFGNSSIDKNLTLEGVTNKAFGIATLDGSGFGGTVLTDNNATVAIKGLTIASGTTGGIGNSCCSGSLTLTDSIVSGNTDAGIRNLGGRITLVTSTVRDNAGGGIDNLGGRITLTDSTVSGNTATASGGGINNAGLLTLTNSTVSGNRASGGGGGIFNSGEPGFTGLTLTNSIVSGNTAGLLGGGGIDNASSLTVTDSIVRKNSAGVGGGILNSGTATLTDSTVTGNRALDFDGGGILNLATATLTLIGSTVSGNSAAFAGGGIANSGGVALSDSTVSGNSATLGGGIDNSGTLALTNSTVRANFAVFAGGGVYNTSTVTLIGTNTFIDNIPDDCVAVAGC
jgi:hypothetical protein